MKYLPLIIALLAAAIAFGRAQGKALGFDQGFKAGQAVSVPSQFGKGWVACMEQF